MMKRKTIVWTLILLLMLGALSGCKQENSLESAAPGDVVEKPETDLTEQDTPVAGDSVEEKKEVPEEKTEEPADQEQGEKQEETTSTQTPAVEEPAEKETTNEESASKEFDKEAWLEEYLVEASEIYDDMVRTNQVYFSIYVYSTDFPNGTIMDEPLETLPDFSCVKAERIAELHAFDENWNEKWSRSFIIEPSDTSKEATINALKALNSLDYVHKAIIKRYYLADLCWEN